MFQSESVIAQPIASENKFFFSCGRDGLWPSLLQIRPRGRVGLSEFVLCPKWIGRIGVACGRNGQPLGTSWFVADMDATQIN